MYKIIVKSTGFLWVFLCFFFFGGGGGGWGAWLQVSILGRDAGITNGIPHCHVGCNYLSMPEGLVGVIPHELHVSI